MEEMKERRKINHGEDQIIISHQNADTSFIMSDDISSEDIESFNPEFIVCNKSNSWIHITSYKWVTVCR